MSYPTMEDRDNHHTICWAMAMGARNADQAMQWVGPDFDWDYEAVATLWDSAIQDPRTPQLVHEFRHRRPG